MQRTLSAPGKLFLCGEYAVLWGGTARVAAVGPRASAMVRRRPDRELHLVVEEGRLVGHATPLGANWHGEVPPAFLFAARAVDFALRAHHTEALGFDLAFAPGPKAPTGHKLGLGGSARTAVLATEAARFVLEARFDTLKLALLAHASAQGGAGSGGDVASIFAGGVVRYRRYDAQPLAEAALGGQLLAALGRAAPVDLWRLPPLKTPMLYAFAGESASTPLQIRDIEQRLSRAERDVFVQRSDDFGLQLEDGLVRGDFPAVREAASSLQRALARLGPVETEGTRRLLALAESYGGVGKISGAGGGDGCILFLPDEERRVALAEGLSARGYLSFPVVVEPGLKGEPKPEALLEQWLG